jgi:hypothetical protein
MAEWDAKILFITPSPDDTIDLHCYKELTSLLHITFIELEISHHRQLLATLCSLPDLYPLELLQDGVRDCGSQYWAQPSSS